jgi:heat shock protein HslJ
LRSRPHANDPIRVALSLSLAAFSGCASSAPAPGPPLENTDWTLVRLADRPVTEAPKRTPTLKLVSDGRRVQAWTGCNRAGGTYELDGGKLAFKPMAVTRMACLDGTNVEPGFLKAVEATAGWKITDSLLVLLGKSAEPLATFEPAKAP